MFDKARPPLKINQLRTGVVLSYINIIIGSIIPMFYTPWMLRLLGKNEYGLYSTAQSIVSYLSLLSLGIGTAVGRYLSKAIGEENENEYRSLFGLFLNVFRIIAAACMIGGIILTLNVEAIYKNSGALSASEINVLKILVLLLTVSMSLGFLFTPYSSVITSNERYIFFQSVSIVTTVLPAVINIIVLYIWPSSISLIIVSIILNLAVQIAYKIYCSRILNIKPLYKKPPEGLLKEIFLFTFWVFLASVVNQLHTQTDKLIISYAVGSAAVTVYQMGATFQNILLNVSSTISSVLTPKITKIVNSVCEENNIEKINELLIRVSRIQIYLISLLISGFAVFGKPFIALWAGEGFEEAYWVALVLMIPASIPLVQTVAYSAIVAMNRHRFRSLVYLCVAVFNVILTIPAVYKFGIIGAAAMTGICSIFGSITLMNWYYWKKIGIDIPKFWKCLLPRFIIPLLMTFAGFVVGCFVDYSNVIVMFISIIIYTAVFAVLVWNIYMNDYEKNIFLEPIKKVFCKLKLLKPKE